MSEYTKTAACFTDMENQILWGKRIPGDFKSRSTRVPGQVAEYNKIYEDLSSLERNDLQLLLLQLIQDAQIPFLQFADSAHPSAADLETAIANQGSKITETADTAHKANSKTYQEMLKMVQADMTIATVFMEDLLRKSGLTFHHIAQFAQTTDLDQLYQNRHPKQYEIFAASQSKQHEFSLAEEVKLAAD